MSLRREKMGKIKKSEDDKQDKFEKEEKTDSSKALFIQRFIAFIIDMILVSLLASVLSIPFVDRSKTEVLENEAVEIMEQYTNGTMDSQTYIAEYGNLYYKIARNNGIVSFIIIVLDIFYFVIYQVIQKGQTLGKKLMKIRVVSDNGNLIMDQMIIRTFLANFLLVDIILFLFMLFLPKDIYIYGAGIVEGLQYVIILASVFMIMNPKNGCAIHDKLAHTKVLKDN